MSVVDSILLWIIEVYLCSSDSILVGGMQLGGCISTFLVMTFVLENQEVLRFYIVFTFWTRFQTIGYTRVNNRFQLITIYWLWKKKHSSFQKWSQWSIQTVFLPYDLVRETAAKHEYFSLSQHAMSNDWMPLLIMPSWMLPFADWSAPFRNR